MLSQYPRTINTLGVGLIITLLLAIFFPPWQLLGLMPHQPIDSTDMLAVVKARVVPLILSVLPILTLIFTVKLTVKTYGKERRKKQKR